MNDKPSQYQILAALRRGCKSKHQIAQATGLSLSAVKNATRRMSSEGQIVATRNRSRASVWEIPGTTQRNVLFGTAIRQTRAVSSVFELGSRA